MLTLKIERDGAPLVEAALSSADGNGCATGYLHPHAEALAGLTVGDAGLLASWLAEIAPYLGGALEAALADKRDRAAAQTAGIAAARAVVERLRAGAPRVEVDKLSATVRVELSNELREALRQARHAAAY